MPQRKLLNRHGLRAECTVINGTPVAHRVTVSDPKRLALWLAGRADALLWLWDEMVDEGENVSDKKD